VIPLLAGALVAGLIGSPHCVGMCGAFATAGGSARGGLAWQVGRLGTYAVLGAVVGGAGATLPIPGPVLAGVAGLFLAWFALKLAGLAPALPFRVPYPTALAASLLRQEGVLPRIAFGAFTALLPCGLLWSALAVAAAAGGAGPGALAMAAFWLGTTPLLLAAAQGLQLLARARPGVRYAVALFVFAAGAWSIGTRAAIPAQSTTAPECHTPVTD
jgi:sulfite exporter TauE/SafE